MTSIVPTNGSQIGGTEVVVTGSGFSCATTSDVMVMMGALECEITQVTDANITCLSATQQMTYDVDNSGTDPSNDILQVTLS